MVIDSSALIAILFEEPDASVYAAAILSDVTRLMSATTLVEVSLVASRKRQPDPIAAVDGLISRLQIVVVPFDEDQAKLARDAFQRYGKGRDRAGLNFGDCFSYALAKQTGERLLFKGNDFKHTDIGIA